MLTLEEKENNFWNIVQEKAKEQGCMFFMDVPSGKEVETDELDAFDTFGWLIPDKHVEAFRNDIINGTHDSGKWDQFFVNEVFDISEDGVAIEFRIL